MIMREATPLQRLFLMINPVFLAMALGLGARAAAGQSVAAAAAADSVSTEYVVYFISSSFCIANQLPEFRRAVAELAPAARREAARSSRTVSLVGVSIDVRADTGAAYLQRLGTWDEIVAGRNWMNSAVSRYVWQNAFGPPTIPQVIVVRHVVTRTPRSIRVGEEEKVFAATGHEAIEQWVARGAPIP
ncbi:MAG TPA: hypothetical protein VF092_30885 [Longimicrobium sp.]